LSFGCPADIVFDSVAFSFGKSFLTCPLQEVPKINSVRKVKACLCEKYLFIVQLFIDVFYLFVGLGVVLQ